MSEMMRVFERVASQLVESEVNAPMSRVTHVFRCANDDCLWPLSNHINCTCLTHKVWKPTKVCICRRSVWVFSLESWLLCQQVDALASWQWTFECSETYILYHMSRLCCEYDICLSICQYVCNIVDCDNILLHYIHLMAFFPGQPR